MKWFKLVAALLVLGASSLLAVLATPQPLFAHQMTYGRYQLWSDRPIPAAGAQAVLDDAEVRIRRSELFTPGQTFRIFICNDEWRLALYSQQGSGRMGGVADTWLGRNIFLRRSDLSTNRLIPPTADAPMADRPLSYYVAHEATHIMESRAFGRLALLLRPRWVNEGYADYVGKADRFDVAENLRLLKARDPQLDFAKSGLYRRYHLEVAYLINHKGWTARRLMSAPPDEAEVLAALKSDPTFGR